MHPVELADDLAAAATLSERAASDTGARVDLADLADELGVTLNQV